MLALSTTFAFPLDIFGACFSQSETWWSEMRCSLTDGRTHFQRHLKDTWKKLPSSVSYEESPSSFSGLLIILVPVQGDLCY